MPRKNSLPASISNGQVVMMPLSARDVSAAARSSPFDDDNHWNAAAAAAAYESYPGAAQERPAVAPFVATGGVGVFMNAVSGES